MANMINQPIIVSYFALIYAASPLQVSARDNIALTGFAKQSSTIYYGTPKRFLWNASLSIDGNKSERTRINGKPTCSATNQQNNPWWRVNLHTDREIERIRVFGRVGTNPEQLRGFRMYITSIDSDMIPVGNLIYADKVTVKQYNSQSAIYDIKTTYKGRFVYIVLEKDKAILVLCEVEVYGECLDGNYGQNCINECGHCHNNDPCDKVTGTCTTCAPGYKGSNCFEECLNGNYGQNCSSKCGHCRNNYPCDKLTGACTTCAPECQDGWFGEDCNSMCGHCNGTEVCDKESGYCSACAQGYMGALCIEVQCQDGWYGEDCISTCGHCNGSESCDKEDGQCSTCEDGYRGTLCIEVCTNYTYGANCLHSCGHCTGGLTCNHKTGLCLACADGYRNSDKLCNTECEFGFYGDGCSLECGLCSGNQTCQSDTGECPDGCKQGWTGSLCQSRQPKSDISLKEIFIYGGVSVAVLVSLAFITSCVCLYRRKKKRRRHVKQELVLYAKAIESEPIPPYEEPLEEEEACYAVGNLNDQSSGYEYLMRDAINVEVAHFPDIYKKLLSVWHDGKTVLYYGFQSLQTIDPMYECIDDKRRDTLDITTLTYKELLCRYKSTSETEKFNLIQGSTHLLQMNTLSIFLSDDVFSRKTFWEAIERHKITMCIQIGKPSISVNDRFTIGCFNIECTSWDKNDFASELNIVVSSNMSGSLTRFKLINCKIWQDWMDVPIDLLWIITMVAHLNNVLDEGGRVIIHCEQHINKAALLAVMSDILIKMETQCHVDILGPIQTARRTIPTAISTYEQFKFLHDVVLLAIQKTCFITEAPQGLHRTKITSHFQSDAGSDKWSYSEDTPPSHAEPPTARSFTKVARASSSKPSHGHSSVVMPSLSEVPQKRICIQRTLPSSFGFPHDRAVTQISGPSFSQNQQSKNYTPTTPTLKSAPQGWSYTQMSMPPLSDAPYDMSYTKMNKPSVSEDPHDTSNTQMITDSLSEVSQGYTQIVMPSTSGASRDNSYTQMTKPSSPEALQSCYTQMTFSMSPD